MNARANLIVSRVCWIAMAIIAIGLIFGPALCFAQVLGRPASESYVTSKINAHASTNNAHADIRAQVFAATTNVNALTIAATNATEAAHAATVQANAAILKNTQQDADISYLYASNANTIAIANLANTRAQAANVTNAQNGAAITSVSNLTVTAQATANAAVSGVTAVSNLVVGVKALNENAITNETDLAALRLYHYGSPDIVESPASWFVFNGAGTITGYSGTNATVVLPWAIGGVPVTAIGASAFSPGDIGAPALVTLVAPKSVTNVGGYAFNSCPALTSVSLLSVKIIGDRALSGCDKLTSASLLSATSIGGHAFDGCARLTSVSYSQNTPEDPGNQYFNAPNVTNYVTNPHATGWGDTFGGRPVVRLPLFTGTLTARDAAISNATFTGGVTIGGTNTAAVVRSTGGYIIGPTISGKQAHIFTDGTNTFQVDVNDLTNVVVTAPVGSPPYIPIIVGTTNELPLVEDRTNGVLYVEIP